MAEIIGTVSAVIGIAQVTVSTAQQFVRLVQAYIETNYSVQNIVDDVQVLYTILTEFEDLRKIAAVYVPPGTFRPVQDGVRNCRIILTNLHEELEKTVGKLDARRKRISLNTAKKLSWLFRAEDVKEKRDDLSRSQQSILLGVSLMQFKLGVIAPGVSLTNVERSRLNIIIKATLKEVLAESAHATNGGSPQYSSGGSKSPSDGVYSTNKGVDLNAQTHGIPSRERLDRVPKGLETIRNLDASHIRWLNDPVRGRIVRLWLCKPKNTVC